MAVANKPVVRVLKNNRTDEFLLMHYAVQASVGWNVAWGLPDKYTAEELQRSGMDAILKSLAEFPSRNGDDSGKIPRLPKDEQARFVKEHLSFSVLLENPSLLVFTPSHRERGGYVGRREDQIQVNLPCTPQEFFETVQRAFQECS